MISNKECENKNSFIKMLSNREMGSTFNKSRVAFNTSKTHCLLVTNKKTNKTSLSNDNRKCPTLYEAEAMQFHKMLDSSSTARCVMCTRVLHPLLDVSRNRCSFCVQSTNDN
ncbi:hypothetical protein ManeNPV_00107 [Malacosoma neustria nucleopolyhedrovirus]|uniref:hypothetical protein n=1 Tax=Malacosoma neustria nuclear polyhedrosis virus TaxID=38012 RepID=UPI000E35D4B2|nr:hypothetical protein ManeNPV_00107 [Malacosoma neustria nucleopolyhedrovirus]AUF81633.1 hypothetical protein ManeNPV_00107 [Malacosoma neustria nucleopolyhedrovirus]